MTSSHSTPSPCQWFSRLAAALDAELKTWRERPLGEMPDLILDARYEKVRHGGSVVSCAVLVAIGGAPGGRQLALAVHRRQLQGLL